MVMSNSCSSAREVTALSTGAFMEMVDKVRLIDMRAGVVTGGVNVVMLSGAEVRLVIAATNRS